MNYAPKTLLLPNKPNLPIFLQISIIYINIIKLFVIFLSFCELNYLKIITKLHTLLVHNFFKFYLLQII